MAAKPFKLAYPKNAPTPALLQDLARFAAPLDGFFSGSFELAAGDSREWFDDNPAAARQLAVFGQDGDGSLYALWLYDGRTVNDAPIVYLNSENDGNRLVADNLEDFLALLALDVGDLGFWVEAKPWAREALESKEDAAEANEPFRAWLRERCGRRVPTAAAADRMTKLAYARHPPFDAWVRRALGEDDPAPEPPARKPGESGVIAFDLGATRDAFEAAVAKFFAAIRKALPKLSPKSSSCTKIDRIKRSEQFHETGKLPPELGAFSELRISYVRGGKQVLCLVIAPEKRHIDASLWMFPHPEESADNARARALFVEHVGSAGKVLVRRGNAS